MLSGAVVAMLDQALLSAMNFCIGLAFISLAAKTDYGIYTQLFGLLMLSQTLQGALANAPLVSLGPKRRRRARQALAAHLFRLQTLISLLLALVACSGVSIAVWWLEMPALSHAIALPFALAIAGQWIREFARKYHFLTLNPHRTLAIDCLYAAVLGSLLLAMVLLERFNTVSVFWAMATANLLAGGHGLIRTKLRPFALHGRAGQRLRDSWQLSKWTLPSVVVTWGSNYSFIYIVAAMIGAAAAAEISAARLLVMPAALCINAWSNTFSPRFSQWVGEGDFNRLGKVMFWSAIGLTGITLAYGTALALVYDLLVTYVLGEGYADIGGMIVLWLLYIAIFAVRKIGVIAMVGGGHYKEMFGYSLANFICSLPILVLATWLLGTRGAVIGLIAVESINLALVWLRGWPDLKRRWQRTGGS